MVEDLKETDLKLHDATDFMSDQNMFSVKYPYKSMVLSGLHNGFPYLMIFSLFVFAFDYEGEDVSELISIVYIFFSLTYVLHFRNLYTKNSTYLKPLRILNFSILSLNLIYQMPIFKCPYDHLGEN